MTFLLAPDAEQAAWLRDLQAREARGEVKVEWSRAVEPSCEHSTVNAVRTQPASACRFCKDGEPYREWVEYWRSLGAPT